MWSCFPCQGRGEKAADSTIGFVAKRDGISEAQAMKKVARELDVATEDSSREELSFPPEDAFPDEPTHSFEY